MTARHPFGRQILGPHDEVPGGIVHQHVDAAEPLDRRLHQRVHLFGRADVGRLGGGTAAGALDQRDRLGQRLRPPPRDHDRRAQPAELDRHRPAHPAASAGDDGDLSLERSLSQHPILLPRAGSRVRRAPPRPWVSPAAG